MSGKSGIRAIISVVVGRLAAAATLLSIRAEGQRRRRPVIAPERDDRGDPGDRGDQAVDAYRSPRMPRQQAAVDDSQRQQELDQVIGLFGKSMSGAFATITQVSDAMSQAAEQMQASASAVDGEVGLLLRETENTVLDVRTVVAATEQLSGAAAQIAEQVSASAAISDAAVEQAHAAVQKVARLREAAELIDSIATLIQGIAGQTNLLALNATIEAARAGEAGKGFAVVANEVKSLAKQTGRATGEINSQIAMIQAATAEAADAIEMIGKTIRDIHATSLAAASAVQQQGVVTQAIAQTVDRVVHSATTVASTVQQAQQASVAGRGHAQTVGQVAHRLSSESRSLSHEINDFLESLMSFGAAREFRTYAVDLACEIAEGDTRSSGRIVRLSNGAVLLRGHRDTAIGTQVEIRIDRVAAAIPARCAGPGDGGTYFQLPMDPEHLDYMKHVLADLVDEHR